MTSSSADDPLGRPVASPPPGIPLLVAKLHPPQSRDRWVPRSRLVDALDRAARHPVTLVAAPAGYGKTTLATQWLDSRDRPTTGWVSLDRGDNDPNTFGKHLAAALGQAGCRLPLNEPSHDVGATAGDAPGALLRVMLNALTAMPEEIVLVLDDFHFIRTPECHGFIESLIEHLPTQAHLVILTRSDPGLRLGRLRASGDLAEIRAMDLSFTAEETVELLAQDGVHLDDDTVQQLLKHTEGWPAGIYLAALSLLDRSDPDDFVRQFSGGSRFVGDYLTEEVLSRHTDRVREFITTVALLDRFCASLCDHILDVQDSARLIRDLERSNLFLVPLDEDRKWFRFHHLFAAVARSELEVSHPDRLPRLHTRAADWFRGRGYIDEAIGHSLAAGNTADVADLVQANWLTYVDAGRAATVLGWLEALGPPTAETGPAARVAAAWMAAFVGDETSLAENLESLDAFHDHGPLPDGTHSVESAVALIQGVFGYGGPVEMLAGARRAVGLETDGHSPHYAMAQVSLGHAFYVAGDLDQAIPPLGRSSRSDHAPKIIRALSLATESLVESERGHSTRSRECAELAMHVIGAHGLRAVPQASLAYTALGQALADAGKIDDALEILEVGLALRRQTSAHGPWGMIHHLLVSAGVAALAGRFETARDLSGEAHARMMRYRDGMLAMHARLEAVNRLLRAHDATGILHEELTDRELEVLRLLPSGLTIHEMAAELHVSANTVKTHARAVYRKLGAHSRADAIRRARMRSLI